MFTVYIIYSAKLDRFYTGFTSDLDVRIAFHLASENRKYTHRADDWELYYEINQIPLKSQAMLIEKHIKSMKSRVYIENLKKYPEITERVLQKYIL